MSYRKVIESIDGWEDLTLAQILSRNYHQLNPQTMHSENMMKLFKTYIHENNEIWNDELKSSIYSIAERMVQLEDKFIDLAFSMGEMEGLSSEEVKTYIRYIADRRFSPAHSAASRSVRPSGCV